MAFRRSRRAPTPRHTSRIRDPKARQGDDAAIVPPRAPWSRLRLLAATLLLAACGDGAPPPSGDPPVGEDPGTRLVGVELPDATPATFDSGEAITGIVHVQTDATDGIRVQLVPEGDPEPGYAYEASDLLRGSDVEIERWFRVAAGDEDIAIDAVRVVVRDADGELLLDERVAWPFTVRSVATTAEHARDPWSGELEQGHRVQLGVDFDLDRRRSVEVAVRPARPADHDLAIHGDWGDVQHVQTQTFTDARSGTMKGSFTITGHASGDVHVGELNVTIRDLETGSTIYLERLDADLTFVDPPADAPDRLFAPSPLVHWDQGSLGFGEGGDPIRADRFYVADLEGDGVQELVVTTTTHYLDQLEPSPLFVYSPRDGRLTDVTDELFPDGPPAAVINRDLQLVDVNGDGHRDFFLSNHGTEAVRPFPGEQNRLYLSDGTGRWYDRTSTHLPAILDFSHGSALADVDGDGTVEIYVTNLGGGDNPGHYLLHQNDEGRYDELIRVHDVGNGIFPPELVGKAGTGFFATFVDVNADDAPDLYVGPVYDVTVPGEWTHGLMINDGDGSFTMAPPADLPTVRLFDGHDPPAAQPEDILTGDLTGNGHDDIVSFVRYGGFRGSFFTILVNHGDGTLTDETETRLPGQSFEPISTSIPRSQLVDIDEDGHLDLVASAFNWTEGPDGDAFLRWNRANDGTGILGEPYTLPERSGPGRGILDADGDGDLDLVTMYHEWHVDGRAYVAVFEGRGAD